MVFPCFRLAGKIWKDWFVGALVAKAVSLDLIFGLFAVSDGPMNPLLPLWIIMYFPPNVDAHWGINTPLHHVCSYLCFDRCLCIMSFLSSSAFTPCLFVAWLFTGLKCLNSFFAFCIGFIRLRNLMREREAAGNVLMGTIDGEESLSRSPCHVLEAF